MENPNDVVQEEQRMIDECIKNNKLSPEELKAGFVEVATELKSTVPPGISFAHMPKMSKVLTCKPEDIVPADEKELVRDYYTLKRLLDLLKETQAMMAG